MPSICVSARSSNEGEEEDGESEDNEKKEGEIEESMQLPSDERVRSPGNRQASHIKGRKGVQWSGADGVAKTRSWLYGTGSAGGKESSTVTKEDSLYFKTVRKSTDSVSLELDDLGQPIPPSSNWVRFRRFLGTSLKRGEFQAMTVAVILIDFMLIILDTDAHAANEVAPSWIGLASNACFMFYFLELIVRAFCERTRLFKNKWNWLDICIIVSGATDIFFSSTFGFLRMMRVLRLLRLLKALRVIRGVHALKELKKLVMMMESCARTLCWATVVMFVAMTLWSIIAVEFLNGTVQELADQDVWGDCVRCDRAFRSVWASNITFWQTIVAGDSWGLISIPLMETSPLSAIIFMGSLFSLYFGILQLIVCVIVDSVAEIRSSDMAERGKDRWEQEITEKRALKELFQVVDKNHDGEVSFDELTAAAGSVPEFAHRLTALDIGKGDLKELFDVIDEDNSGEVSPEEFIDVLYRMMHAETKTAVHFVRKMIQDLCKKQQLLRDKIEQIPVLETHMERSVSAARRSERSVSALQKMESAIDGLERMQRSAQEDSKQKLDGLERRMTSSRSRQEETKLALDFALNRLEIVLQTEPPDDSLQRLLKRTHPPRAIAIVPEEATEMPPHVADNVLAESLVFTGIDEPLVLAEQLGPPSSRCTITLGEGAPTVARDLSVEHITGSRGSSGSSNGASGRGLNLSSLQIARNECHGFADNPFSLPSDKDPFAIVPTIVPSPEVCGNWGTGQPRLRSPQALEL